MTFTVNVLLTRTLYCDAGPGYIIRAVCEYSRLILITIVIFVCCLTFSFGDAVALQSYRLV